MKTICYGFYWARVKSHTVLEELKPALAAALSEQAHLLWLLFFANSQREVCVGLCQAAKPPGLPPEVINSMPSFGRPFQWLFTGLLANRQIQWGFLSFIDKKIRSLDSSPCLSVFPSWFSLSSKNRLNIFLHLHPFIPLNSGHQKLFLHFSDALNNATFTKFPFACLLTKWFT